MLIHVIKNLILLYCTSIKSVMIVHRQKVIFIHIVSHVYPNFMWLALLYHNCINMSPWKHTNVQLVITKFFPFHNFANSKIVCKITQP